jgi:MerR-like DNA binding protein
LKVEHLHGMAEEMTIGRLAKARGVPPATIRFYESQGLPALRPARPGTTACTAGDAAERLTYGAWRRLDQLFLVTGLK